MRTVGVIAAHNGGIFSHEEFLRMFEYFWSLKTIVVVFFSVTEALLSLSSQSLILLTLCDMADGRGHGSQSVFSFLFISYLHVWGVSLLQKKRKKKRGLVVSLWGNVCKPYLLQPSELVECCLDTWICSEHVSNQFKLKREILLITHSSGRWPGYNTNHVNSRLLGKWVAVWWLQRLLPGPISLFFACERSDSYNYPVHPPPPHPVLHRVLH